MDEPFGPEYVKPAAARPDCPDCGCCSARLCERGRTSVMTCQGMTPDEHRQTVRGCPCSGEMTAGTMAWRVGRIRATRHAAEKPFPPEVEAFLRKAADGAPVDGDDPVAGHLAAWRYLAPGTDGGALTLTEFGRVYLAGRDQPRYMSPLFVVSVDVEAGTAEVLVAAWSEETTVTVPIHQLSIVTGGPPENLPGARLACVANVWAEDAEDVIITQVEVAPVLPGPPPVPSAPAAGVPVVEEPAAAVVAGPVQVVPLSQVPPMPLVRPWVPVPVVESAPVVDSARVVVRRTEALGE